MIRNVTASTSSSLCNRCRRVRSLFRRILVIEALIGGSSASTTRGVSLGPLGRVCSLTDGVYSGTSMALALTIVSYRQLQRMLILSTALERHLCRLSLPTATRHQPILT